MPTVTPETRKCFCGKRLQGNRSTCDRLECQNWAKTVGSESHWLSSQAHLHRPSRRQVRNSMRSEEEIDAMVLSFLRGVKGATQRTIANKLGIARSTISKSLTRLNDRFDVYEDPIFDEDGQTVRTKNDRASVWRAS